MNSMHKSNQNRQLLAAKPMRRCNAFHRTCVSVVAALLLFMPSVGTAAPLDLANSPLFIESTVQPNIFYMLDDSGSMDWEVLQSKEALAAHNNPNRDNLDLTPDNSAERLELCYAYNVLAYNPSLTYTPWKGKDDAGVDYTDAYLYGGGTESSPNYNVRQNPYESSGGTFNLADTSNERYAYFPWTDSDGDGLYDVGECGDVSDNNDGVKFNSMTDAQKKNFANWYVYYRKREYVLKRTVSELIKKSKDRVGFSTIHNNNNVGTQIENIDDITVPIDTTAAANKTTLLNNLSRINSTGGTPLRRGLENVGRYFEGVSQTALFGSAPNHTGTISPLSPILDNTNGGACQQNFTILMTDGYYNGGDPALRGNDNTDADGNSPDSAGNTTFDGGAYADTYDNTLADVAMNYYERDLWPTLENKVPITLGVDEADHQHLVTYTVAFGVDGTLSANPPNNTDPFSWPDPNNGDDEKIDDLRHAAYNGRGQFLSAKDPTALDTALSNAISSINDRTGSASSVAANSRSLNTNTQIYQGRFTSGKWSGDLRAIAVNPDGTVGSQIWSADTQLAAQNWDTGRSIITRNGNKGIPFRWVTSGADALTSSQQTALNADPATGTSDGEGQARLNYLRGDASNEGTGNNYRERTKNDGSTKFKLGDIVNSSPIFVGTPSPLPDLEAVPHSSFRIAHTGRREMVYVGANDGMLHGFDAATGDEKIAYVPAMSSHFSNLNLLTDPTYVHRYYVDGSPAVGDAFGNFSNGCLSTACWRTVLVGSMGGGGKGVFALDVTDPDGTVIGNLAFSSESNAGNISLWEFTDAATPDDMGYTYGRATIARVRTSATTTAWAAIFANGYNSVNERAILYVVNIVDGTQIAKINLTGTATGTGNGLSTPAVVDNDGDYIADYVYAGDLLGNMWKIDLTDNSPSNWDSFFKKGNNPVPLFKAVDDNGNAQPITQRPEVGDHPDGETGLMVYFGTGKYLENGDKTPSASPVQTFYGIWDDNLNSSKSITGSSNAAVDRARLLPQTISPATQTIGILSTRTVTDDKLGSAGTTGQPQNWGKSGTACGSSGGNCAGWRVDLLTDQTSSLGEMSVANPVLLGGPTPRIIFTTLIPETAGSCTFGGTSWVMELNPIHGGQLGVDIFGCNCTGDTTLVGINLDIGIIQTPVILRGSANGKSIEGKGFAGSTGKTTVLKNYPPQSPGGRKSWRQLK